MALYVINTTRSTAREEKNLSNFLKLPIEKWVENSYEVEGPLYWTVLALHIFDHASWKKNRLYMVKRLVVLAHARSVAPGGSTSLSDKTVKDFAVYKPYLVFFGLANCIMTQLFAKCHTSSDSNWTAALADYIRNNDQVLQEGARKVLSIFEQEILMSESVDELCDVLGMLDEVSDPTTLISDTLNLL
jgi:E3 ubiquitin-protein ligase UBR4